MNRQLSVWQLIADSLEKEIPVMLLYVLESKGSSPGRQGFFMAVNSIGEMEGSVGGGIMEHKFVEMAKEKLKMISDQLKVADIRKQVHDKSVAKNQSGMICSGEQTILLYAVQPEDGKHIHHIIASLNRNKNGLLRLSPEGISFSETIPAKDYLFEMNSEDDWSYEEKTGYKNQLSIVGGGHCALALSKLMRSMDFYIRVYDERNDLKTMLENDTAHEKHIINNYSELGNLIDTGINHYVVIMTFGYRTDDNAVRALVNKKFKYLGLLGSKTKVKKMMAAYKKEGINNEWLQKIHTPVGITIKSQTPEEIAVSIAAEIIQVKNRDL
jgi:xanthine dehydrogenase accessory factor